MTVHTIQQFLQKAKQELSLVTDSPQLEAEVLLAFVLECPRSHLFAFPEKQLTSSQYEKAEACVKRRARHEPLAYLVGSKEFWSREFLVSCATLIPRPETELLVELTLNLIDQKPARVADLGTGCGAIGLSLAAERQAWQIYATDESHLALQAARKNAERLNIENISFYQGDWCDALPCKDFDAIVSNPPYISEEEWPEYERELAFEPRTALLSGHDGLEAINEISRKAQSFLKKGGYLLVEHGFLQGKKIRTLFLKQAYTEVYSVRDLNGHERVTLGRKG